MGGPYVSLVRFSTFASKFLWISIDVVREEKLTINTIWNREGSFQKAFVSSQYQREMLDCELPSVLQIHWYLNFFFFNNLSLWQVIRGDSKLLHVGLGHDGDWVGA